MGIHNNSTGDTDQPYSTSLFWTWFRLLINVFGIIIAFLICAFIAIKPYQMHGSMNKLFVSNVLTDTFANVVRVGLTYAPTLLWAYNKIDIRDLEKHGIPLADIINALDWYCAYAIIFSFTFAQMEHACKIMMKKHHDWLFNNTVKWVLIVFSWILPICWVLPMFSSCCRAEFYGDDATAVFKDDNVQIVFGSLDLTFEIYFYLPICFYLNIGTALLLHYKYKQLYGYDLVKEVSIKLKMVSSSQKVPVPRLKEIIGKHCHVEVETKKEHDELQHVLEEIELTVVNLLDLVSDAICLLLYILWEGADSGWLNVDNDTMYGWYALSWEVSTLSQTFLIIIFSPTFRKNFLKFYKSVFYRCNKRFLKFFNKYIN